MRYEKIVNTKTTTPIKKYLRVIKHLTKHDLELFLKHLLVINVKIAIKFNTAIY